MATHTPLIKEIVNGAKGMEHRYIPDYSILSKTVKILKNAGYRIVLTQGVYDLFHVGHKRYLEEAKDFGDILIVGVDSDELTKKRKGPKRPLDPLSDRVETLTALRAVDIVTIRRDKEHMYKLIKLVRPNVLVMSQTTTDFTEKDKQKLLQFCDEIKILPPKSAGTTTEKLRKLMLEGAEQLGEKIQLLIQEYLDISNYDMRSVIHPGPTQRSRRVSQKDKSRQAVRTGRKSSR